MAPELPTAVVLAVEVDAEAVVKTVEMVGLAQLVELVEPRNILGCVTGHGKARSTPRPVVPVAPVVSAALAH